MQITQFLVGASYAMAHSFVSYTIPVPVSDLQYSSSSSDTAHAAKNASGPGTTSPSAAATDGTQLLLLLPEQQRPATARVTVACVTTPGETFAIWLNVLYLAPLTYLFMRFFVRSYLRRSTQESSSRARGRGAIATGGATANGISGSAEKHMLGGVALRAERAGWDAAKDMQREVYGEEKAARRQDGDGMVRVAQ